MASFRRTVATALAVAALGTSCSLGVNKETSSSTTTGKTGSSEPAGGQFATTAARGITDDTIKLGAAIIDVDKVKEQFGVDLGLVPNEVISALIAAQNKAGGINGRKVELVERRFIPVGNESSESSCRELIEDDGVFAVMGTYLADNALCVTETYSTPYFGLFGLTKERQDRSKAPYLTVDGTVDNDLAEAVKLIVSENKFKGKKVAVYWESDLKDDWVDANIVAKLKDAGVDVVSQAALPSSGDQVQADADVTRILQRFQADGADTVFNLAGVNVIIPALVKMTYRPTLVFTNGQIIANSSFPDINKKDPTLFKGAYGVLAGTTSDEVAADPLFKKCLKDINDNSSLNVTTDDIYPKEEKPNSRSMGQLPGICALWQLTTQVLEGAGKNPSPQSIVDGLSKLKLHIQNAPDAHLSPERWGAGKPVRFWNWNATTGFFDPEPL